MALILEQEVRQSIVTHTAQRMLTAARTAPKAKGTDNLILALVTNETITTIAEHMRLMVQQGRAAQFFLRDADNLQHAQVLVLIGTKIEPLGITGCGLCGMVDCDGKRKNPDHPCAFNTGDLGIAIGSAVSVAMDSRVDNRVMFSVGMAVRELALLGTDVRIIYGIPLSVQGKNPFFDRNTPTTAK